MHNLVVPFVAKKMDRGGELGSLMKVAAWVAASMTYARFTSSSIQPGKLRLLALLPVVLLLYRLPLHFSTINLRAISSFFLSWLAVFKLLLLASGCAAGPLSPSLPLPTFIAVSSLPVKIRTGATTTSSPLLIPSCIRAILLAFLISVYRYKSQIHPCLMLAVQVTHMYLALALILAAAAFFAGFLLGLDLEPQFDDPLRSTSVQDFWGKRWNLTVTAILRPTVYHPVKARLGTDAGIMAAFIVSGIMHEVVCYYMTREGPTGAVSCFFVIHGVCTVVEVRAKKGGWWRPHPPLAVPAFVAGTAFWLFVPAVLRGGAEEKAVAEWNGVIRFAEEGGRAVLRWLMSDHSEIVS